VVFGTLWFTDKAASTGRLVRELPQGTDVDADLIDLVLAAISSPACAACVGPLVSGEQKPGVGCRV
jgi:hypothetical protein